MEHAKSGALDKRFVREVEADLRTVRKLLPKILDAKDDQEKKILEMVGAEMDEICRILYQN
jgi:hypothetical protein